MKYNESNYYSIICNNTFYQHKLPIILNINYPQSSLYCALNYTLGDINSLPLLSVCLHMPEISFLIL